MRIEIKTEKPIKDRDVKALYLLHHALEISTPRMRQANLEFVIRRFGLQTKETLEK